MCDFESNVKYLFHLNAKCAFIEHIVWNVNIIKKLTTLPV